MNIIADASVDFGIIQELRADGFEVHSILESEPTADDSAILAKANALNYILITEDKDFGELTHRLKLPHKGILLIRLSSIRRVERIKISVATIQKHFDKLKNSFSVFTENGLRIKPQF